jgi:hypothetical protein
MARMYDRRGAYRILLWRPVIKRSLGRLKRRREIIRWIYRKWDGGHRLDRPGLK